jgi:hypothetical protein
MLRVDPDEVAHCRAVPARCMPLNEADDRRHTSETIYHPQPSELGTRHARTSPVQRLDIGYTRVLQSLVQDAFSDMQSSWEASSTSNTNDAPCARDLLHRFCRQALTIHGSFAPSRPPTTLTGITMAQLATSSRVRAKFAFCLLEFGRDDQVIASTPSHSSNAPETSKGPDAGAMKSPTHTQHHEPRKVSVRDMWLLARLIVSDLPIELVAFVARVIDNDHHGAIASSATTGTATPSAQGNTNGRLNAAGVIRCESNEIALDSSRFVLQDLVTALAVFVAFAEFWRWSRQYFDQRTCDQRAGVVHTPAIELTNQRQEGMSKHLKEPSSHSSHSASAAKVTGSQIQQELPVPGRVPLSCIGDDDQPTLGVTPTITFLQPLVGTALDAVADEHACTFLINQIRSVHGKDASADATVPPAQVLALALAPPIDVIGNTKESVGEGVNTIDNHPGTQVETDGKLDVAVTFGHMLYACLKHKRYGKRLLDRVLSLHT